MSAGVPVIDISHLQGDAQVRRRIARACEEWGFFQVVGHGIDAAVMQQFLEAIQGFFALSGSDKAAVRRSQDNPMGFYDAELTKNRRDWKQIYDFGIDLADPQAREPSRWPAGEATFQRVMTDWYRRCERISEELLGAIETQLGASPGAITGNFRPRHTSFLRLNYYPVCDAPAPADADDAADGHLGIHRHTDAGALTVLLQDRVASLQVRQRGRWVTITPEPGALIVNVGDMLQVWSNDRFAAPEHRVLASAEAERFSAPFFYNPAYATDCIPMGTPARYDAVNWGRFRDRRAAGDYADVGEEIQIAHFRRA
jgi:isopenicillin N synthase-like dioxygenase